MNSKRVLDISEYRFDSIKRKIYINPSLMLQHSQIVLVTNLSKNNTILYNFAVTAQGGTYENNTLTLVLRTEDMGMTNDDKLMIVVTEKDRKEELLEKILIEQKNFNELFYEYLKTK